MELQERGEIVSTDPGSPTSPTTANRGPDFDLGVEEYEEGHKLGWFDYIKYLWSTVVTLGAAVIIMFGISNNQAVLPVPVPITFILLFVTLSMLFFLEGLMIGE